LVAHSLGRAACCFAGTSLLSQKVRCLCVLE
jgi:hypothetical protein